MLIFSVELLVVLIETEGTFLNFKVKGNFFEVNVLVLKDKRKMK